MLTKGDVNKIIDGEICVRCRKPSIPNQFVDSNFWSHCSIECKRLSDEDIENERKTNRLFNMLSRLGLANSYFEDL